MAEPVTAALVRSSRREGAEWGPDLERLERFLGGVVAATAPAGRWAVVQSLGAAIAVLLEKLDSAEGDHRLDLESGLILSNYNVVVRARCAREKLRGRRTNG